jgi:hypothetical protein
MRNQLKISRYTPKKAMKTLFFFSLGMILAFLVLSNQNDVRNFTQDFYSSSHADRNDIEKNYNPGDDERFSKEERDYFKEIALSSEYSDRDKGEVCRWKSDMNIYVTGQQSEELMNELNRIVDELNDLIDPININIVNDRSESNYIILFGSQDQYNELEPGQEEFIEKNWGLFVVNGGTDIKEGTMYVDIYRCESLDGQKHLLREELTQSLGLFNDSYKYDNSIFQQRWTETTEYAPIDRQLIKMLYNY